MRWPRDLRHPGGERIGGKTVLTPLYLVGYKGIRQIIDRPGKIGSIFARACTRPSTSNTLLLRDNLRRGLEADHIDHIHGHASGFQVQPELLFQCRGQCFGRRTGIRP